jgi:hypothetical protein
MLLTLLEWSRELSSKGSLDTCISKGHSTFSYAAFTAHMSEGIDKIAVGVWRQPLQRHGPTGGIADEALQLIPPMGRNLGVGVKGKPVDTGTARPGEPWRLARRAKADADAPARRAGALPKGNALLHGGRHSAGERGLMVVQGSYPVATGVSMPISRYPSRRSLRMIR